MGAGPARRRPAYAIGSVDNALRLLQILRDVGAVRGKEAAEELGIAPSSVHRLMAMLVFRGFAVQDESRLYLPGPAIGIRPADFEDTRRLQQAVRPHLERLRDAIDETTNLSILVRTSVRFIFTAEARRPPTGDRYGFVIPAHSSAAGRAILASKPASEVTGLYHPEQGAALLGDAELARLLDQLRRVRELGYSLSVEETEAGIASVAVPIRVGLQPASAVSIASTTARLRHITDSSVIAGLLGARDAIEAELDAR